LEELKGNDLNSQEGGILLNCMGRSSEKVVGAIFNRCIALFAGFLIVSKNW